MKNNQYIYISIYLHGIGFVEAGVISYNEKTNTSCFSYFNEYIDNGYPSLNPATLNYRANESKRMRHFLVHPENPHFLDKTFWELIPQENDWGNHVLAAKFPEYNYLNNLEKLLFLKTRTVGGLRFYTSDKTEEENIQTIDWLDKVREESIDFYNKSIEKIGYLRAINPLSSYGGIRPKCMYSDENGDYWIAKFNLPTDMYNMAIAEKVAMDMAKDCGLNVPDTKLLTLPSGDQVFLSKRFDRKQDERMHSLSLFSLSNYEKPLKKQGIIGNSPGYIANLIQNYSDFKDIDTVNVITKLLLDLGLNNTDNHLRNLRIILNKEQKWELSPMFDIVFNPFNQPHIYNPANLPSKDLYLENNFVDLSLSQEFNISDEIIYEQRQKVLSVTEKWEDYCDQYEMSEEDKAKIANAVSLGRRRKDANYQAKKQLELKHYPKLQPKKKI